MTSAAIVFGLNYTHSGVQTLSGCIQDARSMRNCLIQTNLYQTVRLFTDDLDAYSTSKAGILGLLGGLARDPEIRRVFFYFAGHGGFVADQDGDEEDGRDEVLLPSDYWDLNSRPDNTRLIIDDELSRVLSSFPSTTTVTAVFDCCHSGTIGDLPYLLDVPTGTSRRTSSSRAWGANITILSSCRDNQVAVEITTPSGRTHGLFTSRLVESIREAPDPRTLTTHRLASVLYFPEVSEQRPVVTSSHQLDRDSTFFSCEPVVVVDDTVQILDIGWVCPVLVIVSVLVLSYVFYTIRRLHRPSTEGNICPK